jgi:hypothetical protein
MKNKRHVDPDISGEAAAGKQDAQTSQWLLDIAARADVYEAIRQGVDDVAHRRTRPAREVFNELRRRYGIPG